MATPQKQIQAIWDVVVVGGGPAGMLAAGRASERGQKVLMLEKNAGVGKKLLITGGGRCNVTNHTPDPRALLPRYKGAEPFLYSAFSQFGVSDTIKFFKSLGLELVEEAEGRMFPVTHKARSVYEALVAYCKKHGVVVETSSAVSSIVKDRESGLIVITRADNAKIHAKSCILATGGTSRPETGSTGEGFAWLKALGLMVADNNAALVPLALYDLWAKKIAGIALKDIKLTVYQDGVKQRTEKGKLLFTHVGISGPTVLNMSRDIGELLQYGEVVVMLDLLPALDYAMLKEKLQALLIEQSNKKLKNALGQLIPAALVPAILELSGISGDTPNHSIRHEERIKLIELLKSVPMRVKGLLGKDKAVVSSGGVVPEEINFKTMESRKVPGLYIVGDMINIDRPSGGYSLQLCWTTSFVAGNSA